MSDKLPKIIKVVVEALEARGFSEGEAMQMLGKIQNAKSILTEIDQKMIQAAYQRGYHDGFKSGKSFVRQTYSDQKYRQNIQNYEQILANLRAQQYAYHASFARAIYEQASNKKEPEENKEQKSNKFFWRRKKQ
jgi:hypothetical protein